MNSVVGGVGGGGTPGPIPNPEAKPSSADGTALARVWESRSPPTFNTNDKREAPPGNRRGLFHFRDHFSGSPRTDRRICSSRFAGRRVPVRLLLRDRPARPRSPRSARCCRAPSRTGPRSCRARARTSARRRRRSRPRVSTRARRHPPARLRCRPAPVNLRNHSSTRPFRSSATLSDICDQDRSPDRRSHVTGFPSLHRMERGTGPLRGRCRNTRTTDGGGVDDAGGDEQERTRRVAGGGIGRPRRAHPSRASRRLPLVRQHPLHRPPARAAVLPRPGRRARGHPGEDPPRWPAGPAHDARVRRRRVRGRRPLRLRARAGRPVQRGHDVVRRPRADGRRDRAAPAELPFHRLRERRHPRPGLGHARAAARRVAHRAQRPLRPGGAPGHGDAADPARVGRADPAGRRAVAGRPRPRRGQGRAGRRRPAPWRYVLAGPTLGMDLVLLGPESGRAPLPLVETQVVDALSVLTGRWAA